MVDPLQRSLNQRFGEEDPVILLFNALKYQTKTLAYLKSLKPPLADVTCVISNSLMLKTNLLKIYYGYLRNLSKLLKLSPLLLQDLDTFSSLAL